MYDSYFKMRQIAVIKYHYKVHQVLQVFWVLQRVINFYYKLRRVLQSATDCYYRVMVITKPDVKPIINF